MTHKHFAIALLAMTLLVGCNQAKKQLGLDRQPIPDEFTVLERAPLSVPPEYTLRPPRTATFESNTVDPQTQARRIILGSESPAAAQGSSATEALLQQAGAAQAQPNIRATLDKETTVLSTQNKTVAEKLLFFNKEGVPSVPPAERLDPRSEAEKLNKAGITAPTPGQIRTPSSAPPVSSGQ